MIDCHSLRLSWQFSCLCNLAHRDVFSCGRWQLHPVLSTVIVVQLHTRVLALLRMRWLHSQQLQNSCGAVLIIEQDATFNRTKRCCMLCCGLLPGPERKAPGSIRQSLCEGGKQAGKLSGLPLRFEAEGRRLSPAYRKGLACCNSLHKTAKAEKLLSKLRPQEHPPCHCQLLS